MTFSQVNWLEKALAMAAQNIMCPSQAWSSAVNNLNGFIFQLKCQLAIANCQAARKPSWENCRNENSYNKLQFLLVCVSASSAKLIQSVATVNSTEVTSKSSLFKVNSSRNKSNKNNNIHSSCHSKWRQQTTTLPKLSLPAATEMQTANFKQVNANMCVYMRAWVRVCARCSCCVINTYKQLPWQKPQSCNIAKSQLCFDVACAATTAAGTATATIKSLATATVKAAAATTHLQHKFSPHVATIFNYLLQ